MTDKLHDDIDLDDVHDELRDETEFDEAAGVDAATDLVDDDIAEMRCLAAADAIDELYRSNLEFLDSGQPRPPESLYDVVEHFVAVLYREPLVPWPKRSWHFLEAAVSVCTYVSQFGSQWRQHTAPWNPAISKPISLAHEQRGALLDPTPPPPVVRELESIEELVEQKVSDRQIATIYGWVDDRGEPDLKRVKACKAGEVAAPNEHVYDQTANDRLRWQPHLGVVHECMQIFQQQSESSEV